MDVDEIGLSWHRCGAEDHVPCGVGPDKAGCDRTPCSGSKGIHPRKYKIRVSKMYELSSSHAMWDMSRDMAGFETVAGFSHDVASIGNEKFLDWGWNQFIIPVGFELRLVDASVM
jgi:hypothetical protein